MFEEPVADNKKIYCPRCLKKVGFYENRCENGHYIFEGDKERHDFCRYCRGYTLREDGSCLNGHILFNWLESLYLKARKKPKIRLVTSLLENTSVLLVVAVVVGIYFWSVRVYESFNWATSPIFLAVVAVIMAYLAWMVFKLGHLWITIDPESTILSYPIGGTKKKPIFAASLKEYPFEKDTGYAQRACTFLFTKHKSTMFIFMGVLVAMTIIFVWMPHNDKARQYEADIMPKKGKAQQNRERFVAIPFEIEGRVKSMQQDIYTLNTLTDEIGNYHSRISEIAIGLRVILNMRDVNTYRFNSENYVESPFDIIDNQTSLSLSDGIYSYFLDDANYVRDASESIQALEDTANNIIAQIEQAYEEIMDLGNEHINIAIDELTKLDNSISLIEDVKKLHAYVQKEDTFMPTYPHWYLAKPFYDEWISILSSGNRSYSQISDLNGRIHETLMKYFDLLVENIWVEDYQRSLGDTPEGEVLLEEDLDTVFAEIFSLVEDIKTNTKIVE